MKISELMQILEDLQEQRGDIDCILVFPDTGWEWVLDAKNVQFSAGEDGTGAAVVFKEEFCDATDYTWPAPVKPERFVGPLSAGQEAISNAMHSLVKSMLSNFAQQGAEPFSASYAPGETISIKRPVRFTYRAGQTEQSPSQTRSPTEQSTGE